MEKAWAARRRTVEEVEADAAREDTERMAPATTRTFQWTSIALTSTTTLVVAYISFSTQRSVHVYRCSRFRRKEVVEGGGSDVRGGGASIDLLYYSTETDQSLCLQLYRQLYHPLSTQSPLK